MAQLLSFKKIRLLSFGALIFITLFGGGFLFFKLHRIVDTISSPIQEERPFLDQIFNLQKKALALDLELHHQISGEIIDNSTSIQLIDEILPQVEQLTGAKGVHGNDQLYLQNFIEELKRLKIALIYFKNNRLYDSASSSTEELYEIINESLNKINHDLNSIIAISRRQIAESDVTVLTGAQSIMNNLIFYLLLIIFGTLIIFYIFNKTLSENLQELIYGTKQIGEGNLKWRAKTLFDDEFGRLGSALNDMADNIAESKNKLLHQAQELINKNEQLKQEKLKAQKYLDVTGSMMIALNKQGAITLINKQGCRMLNVSEQEVLGANWFERFLPEEIAPDIKAVFNRIMAGDIEPLEFYENKIVTNDGRERTISFHNALLRNEAGEIEGVLSSGRDITEQKQAEAEKKKLEAQLVQSQKLEAIGTMAGGIAHDFNNIIAIIMGNAELASDQITAESPIRENIEEIFAASRRARDLVGNLLSFSRKEIKEYKPIPFQLLIKETLKFLRATTPASVSIVESISQDCRMIKSDPIQLHQLIMNLFTNAVHAMDEKGEITVSLLEVNLNADALAHKPELLPGPYACLSVSDTGTGMDQETVKQIFDPFFTTKEVGKGTGMGLAVVHGIVEMHGGFVSVESEPGRGSTFHVFIPVSDATEETAPEISPATPLKTGTERILLVDDEESLLEMANHILGRLGYQVTAESRSEKALERFRADPLQFDLLITDQAMPELSGLELIAEILKIRPDMPVILCTGYSSKVSEKNAREKGIHKIINKPYTKMDLAESVRGVLDGRRQTSV